MKAKYYFNILIATTLTLGACKKSSSNNNENPTPTITKYLRKQVHTIMAGTTEITTTTNYTYDEKKRLKSFTDGFFVWTYTYYDNNTVYTFERKVAGSGVRASIKESTYSNGKLNTDVDRIYKDGSVAQEITTSYVYNGDKVSEVHTSAGLLLLYTYNGQGDVTKLENKGSDLTTTTEYTYDSNHRKITEAITYSLPNPKPSTITYAYDSHDNITKKVTVSGTTTTTVNTVNTYDADGYLISSVSDNGETTTKIYTSLN